MREEGLHAVAKTTNDHWTHRLFVEAPEVHLPFLEQAMGDAGWRFLRAFGSDRSPEARLGELTPNSKTMWVVAHRDGS